MEPVHVRPARREDCPSIREIYNEAVLTTTASYDIEPRSLEHRYAWFDDHERQDLGMFVAESENRIVGWSSLSRFHDRFGYRFTVENSVYVAAAHRGRGIGGALLAPLLRHAERRKFHTIIAAIDAGNEASLRLHARFGFREAGRFREVGHKFGRWLDVAYLQYFVPLSPISGLEFPPETR